MLCYILERYMVKSHNVLNYLFGWSVKYLKVCLTVVKVANFMVTC